MNVVLRIPLIHSYNDSPETIHTIANFLSSQVPTCREVNPHPHLCDMLELAEQNRERGQGDPNALIIGLEGVRQWLVERFDVCVDSALKFTDIRKRLE